MHCANSHELWTDKDKTAVHSLETFSLLSRFPRTGLKGPVTLFQIFVKCIDTKRFG